MKRLNYLAPTIESVARVSDDLHRHGVTDWHIHILSKDEAGLYRHQLHSANALQRTDLIRFVERGFLIGSGLGLLFALPALYLPQFSFEAWLAITAFCVLFGTWVGGIGGITQSHHVTQRFEADIDRGQHLIMIDTDRAHLALVETLMQTHHPEAELQGISSTVPNPFRRVDAEASLKAG